MSLNWHKMNTLKFRFTISHILPVLITIPLIALALAYTLQANYVLRDMSNTIQKQSELIEKIAKNNPEILRSQETADQFNSEVRSNLVSDVILFDPSWNAISMSKKDGESGGISRIKTNFGLNYAKPLLNISQYTSFRHNTDIIDMLVPVTDENSHLLGMVRLNFPSTYFEDQLKNTGRNIAIILTIGISLGALFGLILANMLGKQLSTTTNAIYDLSQGKRDQPLTETGAEETRNLCVSFNTLAEKLKNAKLARNKLTFYLSHELGRPLGGLSSAVDAIANGAYEDPVFLMELTNGMKMEIGRLESLIGDLAMLRDEGDPEIKYDFKLTDIVLWKDNIKPWWVKVAMSQNVALKEDIGANIPLVMLDADRFSRAVGNLISNAIKYTPSGGEALISIHASNGEVQFSVIDNGSGIAEEDLPHIFEEFYRGPSKKRITQGMGLGLSIAQDIVLAHHGKITVKNNLGKGCAFTITLPVAEQQSH